MSKGGKVGRPRSTAPTGRPIPTRLHPADETGMLALAVKKGLSASEVIRRSVRLLIAEVKRRGPTWDWVGETAQPALLPSTKGGEAMKQLLADTDAHHSVAAKTDRSA